MNELKEILSAITPPDRKLFKKAREKLDQMAIPRGSLGRLEECAQRVVAISGTMKPSITKKTIVVFAGDHGVVEEGVSAFPQNVTAQMVANFIKGGAGINVLARHTGAKVLVVDMGIAGEIDLQAGLLLKKIARGTHNMRKGPAMTRAQALEGILTGCTIAEDLKSHKTEIIGTGDMGIGNTTSSSAIVALLTKGTVEEVTGRGTGVSDALLRRKIDVIKAAIETNKPDPADPLDVLSKLGGFEIAGIAGLIIGSASCHIPVVIDGFISSAAALVAVSLNPIIGEFLFAAHQSVEPGHRIVLNTLGQKPLLDLSMRLGEGTGAALGIGIVEAGVKVLREVLTFQEAGVQEAVRLCED
jgi:nicotinate-nucleotide--dimethylbenzimidazole phosphoribosyltransferase